MAQLLNYWVVEGNWKIALFEDGSIEKWLNGKIFNRPGDAKQLVLLKILP
jgi:hypothetical protein